MSAFEVEFQKMHGLGNDFVVIELDNLHGRENKLDCEKIKTLANRKLGIGFEQLLLIKTLESEPKLIEMQIFNEDGSEASFCGNGLRCVAGLFLTRISASPLESLIIRTVGPRDTRCWLDEHRKDWIVAQIGHMKVENPNLLAEYEGNVYSGMLINVGNNHAVFFTNNNDKKCQPDLERFRNSVIESGLVQSNVNLSLVEIDNRKDISIRVWESGSGPTLACGSAACASFYAAVHQNMVDEEAIVKFTIGHLELRLESDDNLIMAGPFYHVFTGKISIP